jgi:hypothetical protein
MYHTAWCRNDAARCAWPLDGFTLMAAGNSSQNVDVSRLALSIGGHSSCYEPHAIPFELDGQKAPIEICCLGEDLSQY